MNALKTATMICAITCFWPVASPCAGAAEMQRLELEDVMRAVGDVQKRLDEQFSKAPPAVPAPNEQYGPRTDEADLDQGSSPSARDEIESLKAKMALLQNRTELGRVGRQDVEVISTCLSIGLLAFGGIVLGLEFMVLLRAKKMWAELDFKIILTTLVVLMGVFLVVAGFSQEQITPVIGLLGAIVGYVLGKDSSRGVPVAPDAQTETNNAVFG